VADVIPDLAAVLDQLGANRFYTLGWSGGGTHALACAALLPERLIGAATVGGIAPYDAEGLDWMAGMGQENIAGFGAALAGDTALRTFLEGVAPSFATVTPDEVAARLGNLVSGVARQPRVRLRSGPPSSPIHHALGLADRTFAAGHRLRPSMRPDLIRSSAHSMTWPTTPRRRSLPLQRRTNVVARDS